MHSLHRARRVGITAIACALILGIIVNILLTKYRKPENSEE